MSLTVELSIINDIAALRNAFVSLCKRELRLTKVDPTIITRAIFAQLTAPVASTVHPVFRRPEALIESAVIHRELIAAIFGRSAVPLPHDYVAMCDLLDSIVQVSNSSWQRARESTITPQTYAEVIRESRKLIDPKIKTICGELIARMRAAVTAYSKMKATSIESPFASGRLKIEKTAKTVTFRHAGFEPMTISTVMFAKFQRLYTTAQGHTGPMNARETASCMDRIFILCLRYSSLFGRADKSFHAASIGATFKALSEHLGVTQELYAQPFNCHFDRFCSPFPDVDIYFGSAGRMQDFVSSKALTGSFEVGPPYTEEVMDSMIDLLTTALKAATEPLSFVVFVPDWREPLQKCQRVMEDPANPFTRGQMTLEPHTYEYADGVGEGTIIRFPFRTKIYILQNEAGAARWPYSAEVGAAIVASAAAAVAKK